MTETEIIPGSEEISVIVKFSFLKEKFSLPENLESTALLVMGYPAEDAAPAPAHEKSRPESELVSWE